MQTNLLCVDCVKAMWQGWEADKFLLLLQFVEAVDFEYTNWHGNKGRYTMPKGAFVGEYSEEYISPGTVLPIEFNGSNYGFLSKDDIVKKLIEYSDVLSDTATLLSKWM